jgi:peptidoglycan/xylan/chitin deacetylase (PgdA/CDA1 family)
MLRRRPERRVWRISQGSKNQAGHRTLILLYHRVAELRSDPWRLSVTPSQFAEHLEVLRRYAHPISLQQLSQGLLEGNLPDRSVVITFDDGYADNLYNAKPLLTRYAVPATVFLTTGYIGNEREFWWDELDRVLLQPGALPETLRLSVNGSTYQWKLGKAAHYSEDAAWRHRHWRAWDHRHWRAWEYLFSPRQHLYRSLWELLHPLTEGERRKVLDELLVWAHAEPAPRPTHSTLAAEEVVALAERGVIEVGAHTVTHSALSTLPVASQRDEVFGSKVRLEEILGHRVTSFSYPHGSLSAETTSIIQEAGFTCACSSFAATVVQSTDRFQLPRVLVMDWDGKKFAEQVSMWFAD